MWIDQIKSKIKNKNLRLVLPEAYDPRVLQAASILSKKKLGQIILIGNENKIHELSKELKVNISLTKIIDPEKFLEKENFINKYYELRKDKGISLENAKQIMMDPIYFGSMLVAEQQADCFVGGCIHPTADIIRATIQIIKPAKGIKIISSCTIHVCPNKSLGQNGILFFADPGVVPDPTAQELADIAISAAKKWQKIMQDPPRVAMLSFSTKGSAKHPLVDKVIAATQLAKQQCPEILIDGELQLDAAIVPEIGESKAKGSLVAGKANILVFPDLNAGNIGYKLVQRIGNCSAYGPILQGLNKPCSDLSRGCSAEDIVDISSIVLSEALAGRE